jgi:hypothetical protein
MSLLNTDNTGDMELKTPENSSVKVFGRKKKRHSRKSNIKFKVDFGEEKLQSEGKKKARSRNSVRRSKFDSSTQDITTKRSKTKKKPTKKLKETTDSKVKDWEFLKDDLKPDQKGMTTLLV